MAQYPPRHLTAMLQVSGTTIRRWSEEYSRHLSPSATTAPRRYTNADVAVLRRVKALSDSGMRIVEIDALLAEEEPLPPAEPTAEPTEPTTTALQAFTALADTQRQIAASLAQLSEVAALRAEVAELRSRVARLERAAHKHPWTVPKTPLD